jgi:hypothetical protein
VTWFGILKREAAERRAAIERGEVELLPPLDFYRDTAEQFGMSESSIRHDIAMYQALTYEMRDLLTDTPRDIRAHVDERTLDALARIKDPAAQLAAARKVVEQATAAARRATP